jgi:hypothetical protein
MHRKQITFRQHIVNLKDLTEIIDDLNSVLKGKLALLDETFRGVYSDRDPFSVVARHLGERFNILKVAKRVRQKLGQ